MDIRTATKEEIQEYMRIFAQTLVGNLGIEISFLSEERVEAKMQVNEKTCQYYGMLHGGASLALAESLAGLGSRYIIDADQAAVGMQVSANHLAPVPKGDSVYACARIIHKGRLSHVWNIDIRDKEQRLISSARVTNCIIKRNA